MTTLLLSAFLQALHTALRLVGFSAQGPVYGSLAAWVQSILYGASVPPGGLFALLQSLAMRRALFGTIAFSSSGLVAVVASLIFSATFPFIMTCVSPSIYLEWLSDAIKGDTQESLAELLRRSGSACELSP